MDIDIYQLEKCLGRESAVQYHLLLSVTAKC